MVAILFAQSPGAPSGAFFSQLVMLGIIAVIFYVLLIMPARRRQKQHQAMIDALQAGDKVVTNGGLLGTVVGVDEGTVRLKLGTGVEVTVLRSHIAGKQGEESS
ncbi:MAG: preprotein translocase subunit YajC [Acidobacteriota bacterium]|nr:preprotein translocase subunit YajC [Acidobacteriota bacterium]MDQ7087182.1 preprotein translocase subunit YajC [Acidobacteriota bacterium]